MPDITFKKFIGHLKTIIKHKWWVFYFCCKAGIPVRGLLHDLSKFSFTEFWESVRFYKGTSSPINACKEANGYSLAWQHHKGRNPHHYEYWVDWLDKGGEPIMMPYKYAVEMICDYLGAASAYSGHIVKYSDELNWWTKRLSGDYPPKIHKSTRDFVTIVFYELARNKDIFNSKMLKHIYKITNKK